MVVQVIQAQVADKDALNTAMDRCVEELSPGAEGWLGTTGGVSDDGRLVAMARFESAEAAARNSMRRRTRTPGGPRSRSVWRVRPPSTTATTRARGWEEAPDDAGFVQVIQGRVQDVERADALMADEDAFIRSGRMSSAASSPSTSHAVASPRWCAFASEAEAREGERWTPPSDEQEQVLTDLRLFDLHDPWLASR